MTVSTGRVPGRIFMSYRREDTDYPAAWLYARLASHFSGNQVFKDVDSIELGDDFVEVITTAVESCEVLLALIGNRWLTATGPKGRRLDDPNDFVRVEIEAALIRGVRVIPVLVEGARMPRADELPASLAKLARRQALELSPSRFDFDTQRLLHVLDRTITRRKDEDAPRPDIPPAHRRAGHTIPDRRPPAHVPSRQVKSLTGHTAQVWGVAFSPDGTLLASASDDKTVRLWEVATGTQVRTLTGRTGGVNSVAFSPDGTLLASTGAGDKTVRLWEVATGTKVRKLTGHTARVWAVAFSPDGRLLASGGDDMTVRLWGVATGTKVRTLTGRTGGVNGVAFSPDGRLIASGADDTTVRLWEVASGTHVRTLTGHTDSVRGVAYSPDGTLLASAADDKTVRLWEVASGTHVRTLAHHTARVNGVAFSPDGTLLASAADDKTVRLWG